MSKEKFNLIGRPFQHAHTSTLWKKATNLEWDFSTKQNSTIFYMDREIFLGLQSGAKDGKV